MKYCGVPEARALKDEDSTQICIAGATRQTDLFWNGDGSEQNASGCKKQNCDSDIFQPNTTSAIQDDKGIRNTGQLGEMLVVIRIRMIWSLKSRLGPSAKPFI